jgi:hypothetical protein
MVEKFEKKFLGTWWVKPYQLITNQLCTVNNKTTEQVDDQCKPLYFYHGSV